MVLRTAAIGLILFMMTSCGDPGPDEATVESGAEIEIVASDFAFDLSSDSLPAGSLQTTLVNEGSEPHQAGYYLLDEGVSFEEFIAKVIRDDSAIPRLSSGGRQGHMRPLGSGERGVRPVDDLVSGTYAVLCSIRDPETGKNHYELGMTAELEMR